MSIRREPNRLVGFLFAAALLMQSAAMQPPAVAAESFKNFKLKDLSGTERSLADFPGRLTLIVLPT
jgi:cytochrome oxidase Cu insertion factor (SCO1/SenC/PrrC family)